MQQVLVRDLGLVTSTAEAANDGNRTRERTGGALVRLPWMPSAAAPAVRSSSFVRRCHAYGLAMHSAHPEVPSDTADGLAQNASPPSVQVKLPRIELVSRSTRLPKSFTATEPKRDVPFAARKLEPMPTRFVPGLSSCLALSNVMRLPRSTDTLPRRVPSWNRNTLLSPAERARLTALMV